MGKFKKYAAILSNCYIETFNVSQGGNYLLIVNNRNTKTRREICSKLTIKTPERRQWRQSLWYSVVIARELLENIEIKRSMGTKCGNLYTFRITSQLKPLQTSFSNLILRYN